METIGQGCWLCNIFALSYDISVVLSERVFEKLGAPLANLIAFALGVWVLFQAAKLMTPFGPMAGPTGIANMIFIRLGIALLVMTMLRLGFSAYNDMIQAPLMGAGVALSQELLNTASNTLGSLGSVWKKPDCEDSFIPTPYISAAATYYNNHPEANTTRRNFICLPRQMQDTLGSGMAFGISNIMAAGNLAEISGEAVVRAFDRFFSGVVLVALYFIAIIIFGMFLLDMLFRFILTGALSPIWLASAVFPNTRFAFSQGVRQLARCALTMVLMTVLIVIAAGLIGISTQNALENGKTTLKPEQKTAVEACLTKGAAAAAYCKSKGTADKDCDMSYGSGNAPSASPAPTPTPSPSPSPSPTPAPTPTPTPTPAPAPVGQCPSVNIGSGGGVGAGMGGSVSQPPANTQPWGGSTDPEAIMFSCMMNVGGFTIGLGNPAFYQMLAGVLVVLLYMSRMYNLAAMYVGVSQDRGPTLGQLMAGITMKGIGIAGGAVAGFASAAASMTIAGGGKLLGSTLQLGSSLSPQSAPRDGSGGQPPDAGGGGGQPSGGLSASSDDMSRQSAQGGGIQSNIEIFNTIVDIEYDSYGNATINYSSSSSRAYNGNQAFNESNSDDNPPDADDNSPEQNWASRAGEAMGGGLNDLDNLFEAIGNFWKNLGKIPAKAALAALAPVILATNNAMAQISPEQQAALAKATGATKAAAAHVHRAVETLAQGTLKGASFGFELSEFTGVIALEENKKLTETKEKYKYKKAEYNKDKRRHDYLENNIEKLNKREKAELEKLKEKLPNNKLEVQNLEREVAKLKYENPLFET